mmetsp:Transcript_19337/g.37640  ORF Transcript_19337/g.37640 Transcript_19337/m.37640 type:complete len:512 (+) Transcript_19337:232-1767(+)
MVMDRTAIDVQTTPLRLHGEPTSTWTGAFCQYVSRNVREYFAEWQPTDARAEKEYRRKQHTMAEIINSCDVACFVKPGGICPFCKMALALLEDLKARQSFRLHSEDLFSDEREALRLMEQPAQVKLTFPVIYVRGRRLNGGYEELERMSKDGSLVVLLRMTDSARTRVVPPKDLQLPSSSQKPQFLRTAGGSHWLRFQFYVYGNVLRGIALCQVIVFGIVLGLGGLDSDGKHALWLVLADAAAFVLIGPTPLSPFGCLATFLLWRRRGTVASAVPYKVTFTLYILLLAPSLVCGDSDNPVCDALSSDGARGCARLHYCTILSERSASQTTSTSHRLHGKPPLPGVTPRFVARTAWRPLCSLTLRYSRSSASDPRASPRSSCTRRGSSAPGSTPRLTQSGKHSYNRRARARPARGYTNNGPDQKFRPTDRLQLGRGSYFKASQRMKAMVPKGVVIAHLYQRLIDAGPTSRGNASTAAAIYECDVTTVDPFSASLFSLHGQTFSSRPYRLSFC